MNDGSIWRLLLIPYLLIKIFGLIHRHMAAAAYPLCADLISEHFTPTRETHIFDEDVYFSTQTNLKMNMKFR